jgi:hypothetical protein
LGGIGLPLAIAGLGWGLSSQRGKFELSPIGASLQTTNIKIAFSPFGIFGSF